MDLHIKKQRQSGTIKRQEEFYDRLIPNRRDLNTEYSRYLITRTDQPDTPADILEQECNYYSLKAYQSQLKSCLFGQTQEQILPLYKTSKHLGAYSRSQLWEVKPRFKPVIETSPIALDLPNFSTNFCLNLLDWSPKNDIVAALQNSLYLFNVDSNQIRSIAVTNLDITSVKWNWEGTDLLIAYKSGLLVWSENSLKSLDFTINCHARCYITSMDFSPQCYYLVTGCSLGTLTLYHYPNSMKPVKKIFRIFGSRIATVAFSANGRFIACSGIRYEVLILRFPDCNVVYNIIMTGPVRALAWHPHQLSYICVGDINGILTLHNVSLQVCIAEYVPHYESSVYCVTFNPISYELVTSHWIHDQQPYVKAHTQLNVLESFDRIVDRLHGPGGRSGRVLYLKWSPDGKQIATAGSDETLQIWNFMPNHKSAANKKKQTAKVDCRSLNNCNIERDKTMNFTFKLGCIR